MLSCQEVSRLVSLAQERKLRWNERLRLNLHLMMCKHCKSFNTNIKTLRVAMRDFAKKKDEEKR